MTQFLSEILQADKPGLGASHALPHDHHLAVQVHFPAMKGDEIDSGWQVSPIQINPMFSHGERLFRDHSPYKTSGNIEKIDANPVRLLKMEVQFSAFPHWVRRDRNVRYRCRRVGRPNPVHPRITDRDNSSRGYPAKESETTSDIYDPTAF